MPVWLGVTISFIYGAVIGSFLNVCIWRMPRDESIVSPGSHCPNCNTLLKGRDLVPMLSFLVQKCKCRYCGAPISWRYLSIELLTALYFVVTYLKFGIGVEGVVYALFGASLIATFFIDLEHFIIPDQLNIFGIAIGLVRNGIGIATGADSQFVNVLGLNIPQSIVGILACGGAFFAITVISYYVFKKDAMGGGDVKLAAAIGANLLLGPAMLSFLLAVVIGAVVGVGLIAAKKKSRKDYIPFGPFMVIGAMVVMFFGNVLTNLYQMYLNYAGFGGM